jgi:threonine dehydratase
LSQIRGDVTVVNQVYYEVAERDSYILVTIEDDAGVVLPDATMEDERVIHIKRTSNSMYDVTVSVTGGGLVEGDTAFILRKKYDAITCVAINGEWWIY